MKKIAVCLLIFCAFCLLFLWGGLRYVEYLAINRLPALLSQNSTPLMTVHTLPPTRGECIFKACLHIPNAFIQLPNLPPVSTGPIDITVNPFRWPLRLDIKTRDGTVPFSLTVPTGKQTLFGLPLF